MSDRSSVKDSRAIINGFAQTIRPAFVNTVANTAFSVSLFTLFGVLLALSTKESRRRVVFRLNVFVICLVLTMGVLVNVGNGSTIIG
ncbi:hypothetical protein M404DRAFT_763645 [Pisolithus tinctorius Marx 270]|uniref:Uncharacterized protein n=1 Tax=Pisolithus tinctorius Marx 270 TaxID=870435 RepID=A0A0C3NHD3_PISTI|nr:hypothetical protein M404DRAFT_763645 [Pisolithus tinctorius Marx 270]